MDTKITLQVKGGKPNIKFTPSVNNETFVPTLNNALNTMPQALLNVLTLVPILRPASSLEQEHKVYVFSEGERGKVENDLYKYRKHLYDSIAAVFSQLLTTAFPDIEYIEGCKQYQQEYCATHTLEESEMFKKEVEEVTKYVREHFDEILAEVSEQDEQEEETNA